MLNAKHESAKMQAANPNPNPADRASPTGRQSAILPNLQQIPIRSPAAERVREAFVRRALAEPGAGQVQAQNGLLTAMFSG